METVRVESEYIVATKPRRKGRTELSNFRSIPLKFAKATAPYNNDIKVSLLCYLTNHVLWGPHHKQ
ncbi:hypothetical protein FRX31_028127 [Thalictrum thalictroides]|uniref:Uncharacterized protein n=1 Tax=Thalictrum thalictroides TaxID=46969 RepID=A0A7J6VC09_THATH|nr:hypothetical protein FRX31_028127 [Thalictrum thalictroides]